MTQFIIVLILICAAGASLGWMQYILKSHGYDISYASGFIKSFLGFRDLIRTEQNQSQKLKFGLIFSLNILMLLLLLGTFLFYYFS